MTRRFRLVEERKGLYGVEYNFVEERKGLYSFVPDPSDYKFEEPSVIIGHGKKIRTKALKPGLLECIL